MIFNLIIILILSISLGASDEKKWVWKDNSRSLDDSSRSNLPFNFNIDREASARYEVFENDRPFRPQLNQNGPLGFNNRPNYGGNRPLGILGNQRPGGVYNGGVGGNYGQGNNNYYPSESNDNPGILTGPIPSWVREGPFKNYDKCKCTERFNCNSPGISYGHCDVGKKYCCYSTKKIDQLGENLPSNPVHSPENGILVGPGGPVDGPRLGLGRPGNFGRPSGIYQRPASGGFGLGNRPVHSPENGVLVGPGGPFDRQNGGYGNYGGYARSAGKSNN